MGALLIKNDLLEVVEPLVAEEHFFEPIHARIYTTVKGLVNAGTPATPITVRSYVEDVEVVGGLTLGQYIGRLAAQVTTTVNAPDYARQVRDMAVRRQIIALAESMLASAYEGHISTPPAAMIADAESRLEEIASTGIEVQSKTTGQLAAESLARVKKTMQTGETVGLNCGVPLVHELMGQMMPGDLIVVGGLTSHGKTALVQQMAMNVAREGNCGLVFSIEMEPEHFNERYLALEADVTSEAIENAYLNLLEQDRMAEAVARMGSIPLHIVGIQDMTVPMMLAEARRIKRRHGLKFIAVDHLQFVVPAQKVRDPHEGISLNVRAIKKMAKSLGVPILLISHLNREAGKEDRLPTVNDLFGSGAIEKDADVVLLVHREERALAAREPDQQSRQYEEWWKRFKNAEGKATVILGKRRRGKGFGKRTLNFNSKTATFS